MTLLAVPNVSEGRDPEVIQAIAHAFGPGVFDVSSDPDHHRSVITLRGEPGLLSQAVLEGAREAVGRIDLNRHEGLHPRVGAVDVAPVVHLTEDTRGAACAEALVLADRLGHELELPVYLYGALAGGRTRAELRRPGALDDLEPDFGPPALHPTAGAVLVAARPPLIAFNVEIDADLPTAKQIAALIREGGPEGLPGVRALGLKTRYATQVSTNIEEHSRAGPADVVAAIAKHAPITGAELVAPAPKAAFDGFPEQIRVRGLRFI